MSILLCGRSRGCVDKVFRASCAYHHQLQIKVDGQAGISIELQSGWDCSKRLEE